MGQDGGVAAQENRGGHEQEAESRGRGSKGLKGWEAGEIGGGRGYNAQKKSYIFHNFTIENG